MTSYSRRSISQTAIQSRYCTSIENREKNSLRLMVSYLGAVLVIVSCIRDKTTTPDINVIPAITQIDDVTPKRSATIPAMIAPNA